MALVPVRSHKGAARVRPYWMTNTTLYEGQLLVMTTAGTVSAETSGTDSQTKLIGVAAHYVTAGSGVFKQVLVYDDPEQIFRGKLASGTATLTDVGNACPTSGNANAFTGGTSKISACLLGAPSAAEPIVESLRIVGLAFKADAQNDAEGIFTSSTTATELYVIITPTHHLLNNAIASA